MAAALLAAATAGAFAFGYAARRVELRLADALPPQWEGVDIALSGIATHLIGNGWAGTSMSPYFGNISCTWMRICQLDPKSGLTTL
jgi:hypothetical protein